MNYEMPFILFQFEYSLTLLIGIYDVELVQKTTFSQSVIWLKFKLGFASLVCFSIDRSSFHRIMLRRGIFITQKSAKMPYTFLLYCRYYKMTLCTLISGRILRSFVLINNNMFCPFVLSYKNKLKIIRHQVSGSSNISQCVFHISALVIDNR